MRLSAPHLQSNPRVFRHFTGLTPTEFDALVADVLPELASRDHARLNRPNRRRAIGGGTPFTLTPRDQCLLTIIWLRVYLMHESLGFLFGISHPTVGRIISRILPILEQLGRDGMRCPDPGKRHRPSLDQLLADTPEFAVIVDSWEQPVQRPQDRTEADTYYSGKKKQHTHKTQIAVDETTGAIVALSDPVRGPTADLTLLKDEPAAGAAAAGRRRAGRPGICRRRRAASAGAGGNPTTQAAWAGAPGGRHRVQPGVCAAADRGGTHDWTAATVSGSDPPGSASSGTSGTRPRDSGIGQPLPGTEARVNRQAGEGASYRFCLL